MLRHPLVAAHQPPLSVPAGTTFPAILRSLQQVSIDGFPPGHMADYATEDAERFLRTLALVPQGTGRLLEIGGNPYFTTLLLKRWRPGYDIDLTNYFEGHPGPYVQTVSWRDPETGAEATHRLPYHHVDVERQPLPFPDGHFQVALLCEVLEHFTMDPAFALLELRRVLAPGGHLVLTTPNVARWENLARMALGENVYDPYSGFGPHGRHNREYNRHELHLLLQHCGFSVESSQTVDVHDYRSNQFIDDPRLDGLVGFRAADLGQYLMTRSLAIGGPNPLRPRWLYRSLPAERLAP